MAAPEIDAVLKQESGRIGEEIYYRGLHTSPWIDLPETGEWPEGMGHTINVMTYDRSLPANPLEWDDVTASSGENGGVCIPPKQQLDITQTLREYKMQHTALESPDLCVKDLRNSFVAEEQIESIMQILAENGQQVWIDRNRREYTRLAQHKIICTTGGFVEDDDWLATEPDSVLSGGMLKRAYARMIRLGGGRNAYGNVDGRPTFVGIGSMEITERIFTEEKHREDIRYSNRVPELLAPLGVERLFKGFWLMDDIHPPRHNLVGGEWVEVPPYIWTGNPEKLEENPAYETASFEDFIIFHPDVFRSLSFAPPKNYGQAMFDPIRNSEWNWMNIQHIDDNPDKNWGRFRGVFNQGSKPKFPQYGFVLRYVRCDIPYGAMECDES